LYLAYDALKARDAVNRYLLGRASTSCPPRRRWRIRLEAYLAVRPGLDVDKDLPNDWYLEARRYSGAECLLRLTGARRQSTLTETLIRETSGRIGRAITLTITIERPASGPDRSPGSWAACMPVALPICWWPLRIAAARWWIVRA